MNPEPTTENQEKPAAERPVASAPNDQRRRHGRGRGRSRFKGDHRGERSDRPPRRDHPGAEDGHHKPSGTIGEAIVQVEKIRVELQRVLEDIQDVLKTLEQVEREKTASEEEIEVLRESLRLLQRDPGQARNLRGGNPHPRTMAPSHAPAASASTPEEEED